MLKFLKITKVSDDMVEKSELIEIFSKIDDPETMEKFFSEIFTPKEIKDLALRWELIKMIDEKIPQREIAKRLHISLCKITRGAKIVKNEDSITNRILKDKL